MQNKSNFIETFFLEDLEICDQLIKLHQQSKDKKPGRSSINGKSFFLDPKIKDSTDVSITEYFAHSEIANYMYELNQLLKKYIEKYHFCNWYSPWSIIEPINIQHYKPTQAYHAWHTERTSNDPITASRHLVFMTYLNDINIGGETEFFYQQVKIKPKKGLTVFWPADWTFTHRGLPSENEEKYIITGWYNYFNKTI